MDFLDDRKKDGSEGSSGIPADEHREAGLFTADTEPQTEENKSGSNNITDSKGISRAEFMKAAAENLAAATAEKPFEKQKNDQAPSAEQFSDELEDDFLPDENAYKTEEKIPQDIPEEPVSEEERHPVEKKTNKPKKKQQPKKRLPLLKRKSFKLITRIAGAILGICLIIYAIGCFTAPKDRMGRNVYIENINVSNMTFDEALTAVRDAGLLSDRKIVISCNKQKYEINGVDIGLTPRLEDTVDKAMRFGKTDNFFIDGFANTLQFFAPHKVVPTANVDEATLRAKLTEFGVELYGELGEHQLEIGDGVIIATPGHSGFDTTGNTAVTDAALAEVMYAINTKEKFNNIAVTLNQSAPRDLTAEDVDHFAYLEPKDAYYAKENNVVSVVPNVDGRIIDKEQTAELLKGLKEGGDAVSIPYTPTTANVTAETLQSKLFNATIGSYTTSYGTSNANRCANIANAAGKINGKTLLPGEVFSFNAAVGPRSVANGFYTAKEYVNGETVDGIGGGTCQVSSTLYNACIYSDLSIVSRTNHMFPVGYCPLGQDATVADTGVDFKFVNSMDYPIKISAVAGGYKITISIIGTQRDDPRTVKVINSTTKIGEDTKVTTTRQVYNSAGQLISTDQLPGSYYKPHN